MRNIKEINSKWYFSKEAKNPPHALPTDWESVELPHTWNGTDGQDGGNDYYRGKCFYAKELLKTDFQGSDEYYIQFDAVNSSSEVYFNGEKLITHHGGYSAFRVKINEIKDKNLLVVAADNSPNDFVYPQNADFTFYGGIYRSVKIVGVPKKHFSMEYFGSPGIVVTPEVKEHTANISMQAYTDTECEVQFEISDAEGALIFSETVNGKDPKCTFKLENAHLWDGVNDPYLYKLTARISEENGDEVSCRFGCRSFSFDPNKGFFLNGRSYPLRGVSRHQDRPEIGNALKYEHHKEDMDLICEMGANTIRLAHYQHAQEFYDLCDERGLVVWAEIPYISSHMPNGRENTVSQMKELIVQNYNHPCIVTWGLSNEITMGGAANKDMLENHRILNELVHSLDKTRPTTMAVLTMCDPSEEITHISDILSYNHYFGWYGGNVDMYGPWFDNYHKKYPDRVIGISEYGCEALNWHTSDPEQGDYTEEYQSYYHEELIKQISKRPYLWATHVWNMFDFAADARAEGGENGMNHKGLVTFDRKYKKDSFYAYKAWLSDEPFVHLCSKRYVDRVEDVTCVTVYSNLDYVELYANGELVEKQEKGEFPFFKFKVKNEGETKLVAKSGEYSDESIIRKVDTFNEDYRMKEEGAVINWFEITTPPGRYSVNDTIGDIISTLRGKIFAVKLLKMISKAMSSGSDSKKKGGAGVAGFKVNKTMLSIAKGFTLKRALTMMGGKISKEDILKINAMLNKIKKK